MKKTKKKDAAFSAACLFPALFLTALFVFYPTLSIFRVSLYKWSGYSKNKIFIGLENYKTLFSDERFLNSLKNSLILIVTVT